MTVSEAKKRANAKYANQHCRYVGLKFTDSTDADILKKLNSVDNVQGYIKRLIREDIERSQ